MCIFPAYGDWQVDRTQETLIAPLEALMVDHFGPAEAMIKDRAALLDQRRAAFEAHEKLRANRSADPAKLDAAALTLLDASQRAANADALARSNLVRDPVAVVWSLTWEF